MRSSASRLISSPGIASAVPTLCPRSKAPPSLGLDPVLAGQRGGGQRVAGGFGRQGRRAAALDRVEETLEQVDGDRENRGRVLLGGDLLHRLQVAQLDGRRLGADDARRLGQFLGGL